MPTDQCDLAVADPLAASVADFILATTMVEAVELSNLDSGGSRIDCERLNMALRDAYNDLTSVRATLSPANAAIVTANLRRWMIIQARYYLDSVKRRTDVTEDFKLVQKRLEELKRPGANSAEEDLFRNSNVNGKRPVWTESSLLSYNSKTFGV